MEIASAPRHTPIAAIFRSMSHTSRPSARTAPLPADGPEGRIRITLTQGGGGMASVRIDSTRPQVAQKLMAGRRPEQAVQLAGMLFSLCGKAQAIAAGLACGAARGRLPEPAERVGLEHSALMELGREHAWRLLVNWPEQAGLPPDLEALLGLRAAGEDPRALAAVLERTLGERLLGQQPHDWLAGGPADFRDWLTAGPTPTARLFADLAADHDPGGCQTPLLPAVDRLGAEGLVDLASRALATPAFCARPVWGAAGDTEQPRETGSLARQQDHPLVAAWIAARGRGAGARQLARLVELALLPGWLRDAPPPMTLTARLDGQTGVAGVETSRGLLIHVARLLDGQIAEYRILAPTEWNFHPAGPLAQALAGLDGGAELESRARLVAQSLDPCVDYGVEVIDA